MSRKDRIKAKRDERRWARQLAANERQRFEHSPHDECLRERQFAPNAYSPLAERHKTHQLAANKRQRLGKSPRDDPDYEDVPEDEGSDASWDGLGDQSNDEQEDMLTETARRKGIQREQWFLNRCKTPGPGVLSTIPTWTQLCNTQDEEGKPVRLTQKKRREAFEASGKISIAHIQAVYFHIDSRHRSRWLPCSFTKDGRLFEDRVRQVLKAYRTPDEIEEETQKRVRALEMQMRLDEPEKVIVSVERSSVVPMREEVSPVRYSTEGTSFFESLKEESSPIRTFRDETGSSSERSLSRGTPQSTPEDPIFSQDPNILSQSSRGTSQSDTEFDDVAKPRKKEQLFQETWEVALESLTKLLDMGQDLGASDQMRRRARELPSFIEHFLTL